MKTEHTQEPWSYGEDNDGWYVEKDGLQIAHGLTEEDARRIVACVNACAGIPTDVLEDESILKADADLRIQREELEKQRDELLAALERLSFAAMCRDSTMGDPCRLIEVRAELAAANKQACVTIASVKEKQNAADR